MLEGSHQASEMLKVKHDQSTIYGCATRVQDTSGWKFRPRNCRFISVATRTVGQGDLPAEASGTDVSHRAAAIWQAVTRVNLEQAPKGKSWMPTRPIFGEGRSGMRKQSTYAFIPIHRGNEDGMSGRCLGQRGRPVPNAGSRPATVL